MSAMPVMVTSLKPRQMSIEARSVSPLCGGQAMQPPGGPASPDSRCRSGQAGQHTGLNSVHTGLEAISCNKKI